MKVRNQARHRKKAEADSGLVSAKVDRSWIPYSGRMLTQQPISGDKHPLFYTVATLFFSTERLL